MTVRADIAKAMYIGTKEVFKKNLEKAPKEEWKEYATVKTSDKMEEEYATIGNLKPAHIKAEGEAVEYGKMTDGNVTTVKNETVANGLTMSMEAKEDDQWAMLSDARAKELIRTMQDQREEAVAEIWNNVQTSTGANGVTYANNAHPLLNSAGTNDNLVSGVFDIDNYKLAVNKFNAWKNHTGKKFVTKPSAFLCHRDRQTEVMAMLESTLVAFESSNTKNTVPKLTAIFSTYIDELPVHVLDTAIDSAIFQRRKEIQTEYDYDKRSTYNFYFNIHERYKAAMINPGFGFVTITGE